MSGGHFRGPGGKWCCLDQGGTQIHEEKGSARGCIWEEELLGLADQQDVRMRREGSGMTTGSVT